MKVLITGCNRGIGRGVVDKLLEKGHEVIGLNRTSAEIKSSKYKEIICDVSNYSQIFHISKSFEDNLDVIIANAGVRKFFSIENIDLKDWENSIKTNLSSIFYLMQIFVDKLRVSKGYFIVVGSHAEKYPFQKGCAYSTSKGGIIQLINTFIEEERYNSIRATYLSIGSVKNRDHGGDESWKLKPENIGEVILNLIELPKNILIPYMDVRPLKPLQRDRGIEFLQQV